MGKNASGRPTQKTDTEDRHNGQTQKTDANNEKTEKVKGLGKTQAEA